MKVVQRIALVVAWAKERVTEPEKPMLKPFDP
jgi:hypothetical protein